MTGTRPNLGGSAPDFFDALVPNAASAWTAYGPLTPCQFSTVPASTLETTFIRSPGAAGTTGWIGGYLFANPGNAVGLTGGTTAFSNGERIRVICKLKVTGFASLVANALAGFELSDQSANTSPVLSKSTAVSTAIRRITAAVDSTGKVFLITCDGTTVTATDTGRTVVSGTAFGLVIDYTVGTGVVVTVDGVAANNVAATLPTRLMGWAHGVLLGSAVPTSDFYGGGWKTATV